MQDDITQHVTHGLKPQMYTQGDTVTHIVPDNVAQHGIGPGFTTEHHATSMIMLRF